MTTATSLAQKRETPGERGDALGAEGYRFSRSPIFGVYLLQKPDRTRTYRVDCVNGRCNCQSTAWWGCKHLAYANWFYVYDRAARDLAAARLRGVLIEEHEAAAFAAEWHLGRIVGAAVVERMAA